MNYFRIEKVNYVSKKGEEKSLHRIVLTLLGIDFEMMVKGDMTTLQIFHQIVDKANLEEGEYVKHEE